MAQFNFNGTVAEFLDNFTLDKYRHMTCTVQIQMESKPLTLADVEARALDAARPFVEKEQKLAAIKAVRECAHLLGFKEAEIASLKGAKDFVESNWFRLSKP